MSLPSILRRASTPTPVPGPRSASIPGEPTVMTDSFIDIDGTRRLKIVTAAANRRCDPLDVDFTIHAADQQVAP